MFWRFIERFYAWLFRGAIEDIEGKPEKRQAKGSARRPPCNKKP